MQQNLEGLQNVSPSRLMPEGRSLQSHKGPRGLEQVTGEVPMQASRQWKGGMDVGLEPGSGGSVSTEFSKQMGLLKGHISRGHRIRTGTEL